MKKYIATIPIQNPQHLTKNKYHSDNNFELESSYETFFPLFIDIDKNVTENEQIAIVLVKIKHQNSDINLSAFTQELNELSKRNKFKYSIEIIETEFNENIDSHLTLFENLIHSINTNDNLVVDITYGTKPMPIIMMMALNYATACEDNTLVDKVLYGRYNFVDDTAYIHDVSALFYMNSLVEKLGRSKVNQPKEIIKSLLKL